MHIDDSSNKKKNRYYLFVAGIFAIIIAAWIVVALMHARHGSITQLPGGEVVNNDGGAGSASSSLQVATQTIKNIKEHYEFAVPSTWYVEKHSATSLSLYPNYDPSISSSIPFCKLSLTVFPYSSEISSTVWLKNKFQEDPTLDIVQQSLQQIFVDTLPALRWTGTIDAIPTILMYAFGSHEVYEIVPSSMIEASDNLAACESSLQVFLKNITL